MTGRRSRTKKRSVKYHSRNGKRYFSQSNAKNTKNSHDVINADTQQSVNSTGASSGARHITPQSNAHSRSLLKIPYTNAQGKLAANRKETWAELAHISSIAQWDIICLTESSCQGHITTNTLPGYQPFAKPRNVTQLTPSIPVDISQEYMAA